MLSLSCWPTGQDAVRNTRNLLFALGNVMEDICIDSFTNMLLGLRGRAASNGPAVSRDIGFSVCDVGYGVTMHNSI